MPFVKSSKSVLVKRAGLPDHVSLKFHYRGRVIEASGSYGDNRDDWATDSAQTIASYWQQAAPFIETIDRDYTATIARQNSDTTGFFVCAAFVLIFGLSHFFGLLPI